MNWNKLIFYDYIPRVVIMGAVRNKAWQLFRETLKGQSLKFKYERLQFWHEAMHYSSTAKVQITNYVRALKRGGLI